MVLAVAVLSVEDQAMTHVLPCRWDRCGDCHPAKILRTDEEPAIKAGVVVAKVDSL